jgi:hypothetical protein
MVIARKNWLSLPGKSVLPKMLHGLAPPDAHAYDRQEAQQNDPKRSFQTHDYLQPE